MFYRVNENLFSHTNGQKEADLQHGSTKTPFAASTRIFLITRLIIEIGGTNKPFLPPQFSEKASIPVE